MLQYGKDCMNRLRLVVIFWICLILLPVTGWAADDGYGYPIHGSYEATILGTPDNLKLAPPDKISIRQLVLNVIPDIKKPDVFFYDKGLRCTLAYQHKKAPLVFVIAGTGAGDQSQNVVAMMKGLYRAGYHVITLPSPTYPNFIISASYNHVPGDLTEDAADLYRVMESAWNKVKGDIEVSDFYLCGYSLGGTQAAFVAKLDEERKIFNFRKVLMVNPAVNLYNSVMRIEGLLDKIPGGPRKIGAYFNSMMAKFTEFYRRGDFIDFNDEVLYAVYKSKLFSHVEDGGLIGLSYRISSAGMIFTSDIMTNGGYVVPKNRFLSATDPLGDYFLVCVHLSFINYFNEYLYPYLLKKRPELTKEAFIDSLSLKSIEGYLKSSSKFGVMTNDNDFILVPGELDYLRQLFGERTKVYPRGGHLGNLEYRDNMAYIVEFFK
ncbi:MAG: alpha/beta hydrolase family protein [Smithella sp.]